MKKSVSSFFVIGMLSSSLVLADTGHIPYTSLSSADPLAPASVFTNNSIGHGVPKKLKDSDALGPRMTFASDPATWATKSLIALTKAGDDCNIDAMVALPDPAALINFLKTHNTSCLSFLWTWSTSMDKLFSTANLTAVANEVTTLAPAYPGTNTQHMDELLTFLRLAYYNNFYHKLSFDKLVMKPLMVNAATALFASPRIFDSTNPAGNTLDLLLNTVDTSEIDQNVLPQLEATLQVFLDQMPARLSNYNQQVAIYSALYTISRSVNNKVIKEIDANLISQLRAFSVMTTLASNYVFIANNALWGLGKIYYYLPAWKASAGAALEAAYNIQPKWSPTWLWVVRSFNMYTPCVVLSTGEQLCLATVRDGLKAKLFPNTYNYEDGAIKIKTGLNQVDMDPIYYATKEVKAQFGRVAGHLTPVPNDPNANLNVIIYASPKDYSDYHTFLFNLDSNNGGIYIEQDGTYYTYQRTTRDSIYSLQELARHEYTHYLVGRYFVEGMWGEVPIYNNSRMVFFDEGIAEFFAGSTPKTDVALRYSLVNQIKNDKTARWTIPQIVTATYSSESKYYRYSGLFFHFLYKNHFDMLKSLIGYVSKADGARFDAFVNQLKANTALNTEYQSYLDQAVAKLLTIGTPTTVRPTSTDLIYYNTCQIETMLADTKMVTRPLCSISANQTNILFNCQGEIKGPSLSSQDPVVGWNTMNTTVNQFMLASYKPSTNMNWMNCWFGNVEWTPDSQAGFTPSVDFSCDGPLGIATTVAAK